MNPRKVDAPGQDTNIVDDFASEEHVLETQALELFPLESRQATAQRTTVLDFEKPAIKPWPPVTTRPTTTTNEATRPGPRRSILRLVGTVGVIAVLVAMATVGGAAVRSRLDVSVLSNYLQVVRTRASALRELLPQLEVVRDSGSTASATKVTESPPAPVATTDRVAAVERPEIADVPVAAPPVASLPVAAPTPQQKTISPPPTRASVPSPRRPTLSSLRAAAAPPPARPVPPPIERPEASPAPAPAPIVSASAPSPAVAATSLAPPVAAATVVPLAPESPAAPPSTPNSPPPRAVVSAPSTAPAGTLTSETRAVALALNRYQNAFSALDANAAHAVWPSVDVKALARAFDQLETQTFDLEGCDITVSGARAEADCAGNARYVRKVGNKALRVEPRRWHFTLQQTNDQWIIDAVNAR
jgi:hypothetical protein